MPPASSAFQDTLDQQLLRLAKSGTRLLFYPSSGTEIDFCFGLGCDVIVCADKWAFQAGRSAHNSNFKSSNEVKESHLLQTEDGVAFERDGKWVFLFSLENRAALKRIRSAGHRIACFVGVTDGCIEGGNSECVNDLPFFQRVLALASETGMLYLTDHSPLFSRHYPFGDFRVRYGRQPAPCAEFILGNLHLRHIRPHEAIRPRQWGPIHEFSVTAHHPTAFEVHTGGPRLTVEHDSIHNHLHELDGMVISRATRNLAQALGATNNARLSCSVVTVRPNYFRPSLRADKDPRQSILRLLNICAQHNWAVVGTTAFGEGHYDEMLQTLAAWQEPYPDLIRIFYLDTSDYAALRS